MRQHRRREGSNTDPLHDVQAHDVVLAPRAAPQLHDDVVNHPPLQQTAGTPQRVFLSSLNIDFQQLDALIDHLVKAHSGHRDSIFQAGCGTPKVSIKGRHEVLFAVLLGHNVLVHPDFVPGRQWRYQPTVEV